MKYKRTEIGENIGFNTVTDEKFKTDSLSVKFITKLDREDAADKCAATGILTVSDSKYKTLAKLSERLSELYGALLGFTLQKRGDLQVLSINSNWIDNKFAIDGEDITGDMLDIIRCTLFHPNADTDKGCFDKESFEIVKKELLDRIEAEINDKRGYALMKAEETAFKGEPAEYSVFGPVGSAQKITPESVFGAYKDLLEKAQIEIFYVCADEDRRVYDCLREGFSSVTRDPVPVTYSAPSKVKEEIIRSSDEMDVNQCKMVMTFKTDSEDIYALRLLCVIFGGTPVSKLFMNVREKLSLCYYCSCRPSTSKSAIFVDSGVERENLEKAEKEIILQLDEIRRGNFTDEDVRSALLSIDNDLNSVGDTPSSYVSWYFERLCEGNVITPQEQYDLYCSVTRERIIAAASSIKLDSVYTIFNKNNGEDSGK